MTAVNIISSYVISNKFPYVTEEHFFFQVNLCHYHFHCRWYSVLSEGTLKLLSFPSGKITFASIQTRINKRVFFKTCWIQVLKLIRLIAKMASFCDHSSGIKELCHSLYNRKFGKILISIIEWGKLLHQCTSSDISRASIRMPIDTNRKSIRKLSATSDLQFYHL